MYLTSAYQKHYQQQVMQGGELPGRGGIGRDIRGVGRGVEMKPYCHTLDSAYQKHYQQQVLLGLGRAGARGALKETLQGGQRG